MSKALCVEGWSIYLCFILRYVEAEGVEKTYRYHQKEIASAVPLANQQHYFDLKLGQLGPYAIDYSRNGRSAAGPPVVWLALLLCGWVLCYFAGLPQIPSDRRVQGSYCYHGLEGQTFGV